MSKIVVSGTTAAPVFTKTDTTITDKLTLAVMAPLGLMGSDADKNEFYSKDDIAIASVGGIAAGVFIGDKWGSKIPVLGGRRELV